MRRRRLPPLALLAALAATAGGPRAAADPPAGPPSPPSPRDAPRLERILVVTGSHLDVGFTAPPSVVRAQRVATLDAAIDAAEKDPTFRWTEEGGWVVHAWLEAHAGDAARIAKAKALVKARRIGIGAGYVNPHAALFVGGLHHLFAFHDEVEKALGVRPTVEIANDVPSVPEALADAAAAAGVEALLCGANLSFSPPLPPSVTSGPFVWKTAAGNSVFVSIDPDSYTAAFTRWGIDPATARFMARDRFGAMPGDGPARAGIEAMARGRGGVVVVQHAFDNWGVEGAQRVAAFAATWNAHEGPRVVPAVPSDALAAWKAAGDLPVREGEWGGTWEEVRAGCPFLTARLRRVAAETPRTAPLARRLALAAAMDHTGGLGPGWPGIFTADDTRKHAAEWAAILREAIGPGGDPRLGMVAAVNEERIAEKVGRAAPAAAPPGVDRAALDSALRVGRVTLAGAWFPRDAAAAAGPHGFDGDGAATLILWARVDRRTVPGDEDGIGTLGWDVALDAATVDVRAWPEDSASAAAGRWLLDAPPPTLIAPDGIVVRTPKGSLRFSSGLAFAWRVVDVAGRAHVQALLVRQSRRCELKGGAAVVLPFEELYPQEPAVLDAEILVEPVRR